MRVLNSDLEIVELDNDYIFERSKAIINKHVFGQWFDFRDYAEDCVQECALLFYSRLIRAYDVKFGVSIWIFLKVCYKKQISKFLTKQKFQKYSKNYDDFANILFSMDFHNWQIETMTFSEILTAEQKQILTLILHGYEYSEIFDIVCPANKTKDKKRPIYRRVAQIKSKLARFCGLDYQMPDHSGNLLRSEKSYQKYLMIKDRKRGCEQ